MVRESKKIYFTGRCRGSPALPARCKCEAYLTRVSGDESAQSIFLYKCCNGLNKETS